MTKHQRTFAAVVCGIIAFFFIIGLVGDYDYCEQIILHMTQEQYDSVKSLLTSNNNGQEPSDREIAHWWAEHNVKE